jgi:hypothetical protein
VQNGPNDLAQDWIAHGWAEAATKAPPAKAPPKRK